MSSKDDLFDFDMDEPVSSPTPSSQPKSEAPASSGFGGQPQNNVGAASSSRRQIERKFGIFGEHGAKIADLNTELDDSDYLVLMNYLNRFADKKTIVIPLGLPGSGKSWLLSSLINYLNNNCQDGSVTLVKERSSLEGQALWAKAKDVVANSAKNSITSTQSNFFGDLTIRFTPYDEQLPEAEVTFLDLAGEVIKRIHTITEIDSERGAYQDVNREFRGKFPDALQVIFESNVNIVLLYLYDPVTSDTSDAHVSQAQIMDSIHKAITEVEGENKKYFKALIYTKADGDRVKIARDYEDPFELFENPKQDLYQFVNMLKREDKHLTNNGNESRIFSMFYSVGEMSSRGNAVNAYNEESPRELFNWIYYTVTGDNLVKEEKPGFFARIVSIFTGK